MDTSGIAGRTGAELMVDGAFGGLLLLDATTLLLMLLAVLASTVVAIIPGLGGLFGLVILLPFALQLEPAQAIVVLVAASAVNSTGNTITSVLFGVPGSPGGVAVVLDGYPMAQRGEGVRAVAAGLGASVVGGLVGAAFLAASLPVLRPLVLALGPPEFFALALIALVFAAYVGRSSTHKALVAGAAGLMLSFVGLEASTGTPRFTGGQLYLWDGISLVPLLIGLFALAEMIALVQRGGSIAPARSSSTAGQIRRGLRDVLTHRRVTFQGGLTGIAVGLAPGMGDAAAQFLAYANAARSSPHPERFGRGAVEGVIGADAATNAKDGGALVPTLAFGIPGSSAMAVLLAAFSALGIRPGLELLQEELPLLWLIIWVLVLSNLVAGVLCLSVVTPIARLTQVRGPLLVPPIVVVALLSAYASSNNVGDLIVATIAAVVGYGMQRLDYSRATFLIGFVLGPILERNYLLSMRLYGASFLLRPVTVTLLALGMVLALRGLVRQRR